ncbi:MAG: transposase [Ruminiclostridium sp.]|nr:transposase [Ruminiclostridium sp.]MBQ9933379.1 transposase [Ruminiclostridium sp.]
MGTVTKVMKYELRYLDGSGSFHDMQNYVWQLQRQTREILNRTIQEATLWDYRSREHFLEAEEYLDVYAETGYKTLDGYIYNRLKGSYGDFAGANLNATLRKAWKKYKTSKTEVLRGTMSLPSYKGDQPLVLHNGSVKLQGDSRDAVVELTLFSNTFKKREGIKGNPSFSLLVRDNTQRSIYQSLIDGVYKLGECQLVYQKKKWFLLLTYTFEARQHEVDPEKILGVDLGEAYAIYASSKDNFGSLKIEGGEVTDYAKGLERRKRALQQQARYCGEGRVGHGTKTRVTEAYKAEDRLANFRKTINHRYSKALIDYAVKNGYGTIQMEDLSGIKADTGFPKRLQHWTYYDLQSKIEAKAKEYGIHVVKVDPSYTSQRCSKCGHIDSQNRKTQERFLCVSCGFSCNADFNASQNLSIKGIEKIIKKTKGAKVE